MASFCGIKRAKRLALGEWTSAPGGADMFGGEVFGRNLVVPLLSHNHFQHVTLAENPIVFETVTSGSNQILCLRTFWLHMGAFKSQSRSEHGMQNADENLTI